MAGVIHISEEEATRNFEALMQHIRSGDEVRLDCKDGITAVVKRTNGSQQVATPNSPPIAEDQDVTQGLALFKDKVVTEVAEAHNAQYVSPNSPAFRPRTIAEALEILRIVEQTEGLAIPDPDMASDMDEIHALYNQPMDMSRWD